MAEQKSKFTRKVSPLVEGQVPDFVQADHPVFVDFVRDYFNFLEAGRLKVIQDVNYIIQETTTKAYVLNSDEDRIVTEQGDGTTGQFVAGEIITGATTGATATVLVDDSRNNYVYISGQQRFQTGEIVNGGTSSSTATVDEYRGNPIQSIQQMLEYADVDNTLYDFLDNMRDQFMVSLPETLADGISKRDLIKNIKDLYTAKGTSEGHKLFMRILLGETGEIFYPNTYMLRLSDADWRQKTILRVQAAAGVEGQEIENAIITGQTSGATAVVISTIVSQQAAVSVTEFELDNVVGTFTDGETVTGNSTVRDVEVSFVVKGIVASTDILNDGILHTDSEPVDVELVGNSNATIVVDGLKPGSVSEVIVDDVGSGYAVGESVTFTSQSVDSDINAATGFVSMIGGGVQLETGTLDDADITDDSILLEEASIISLSSEFNIQLEQSLSDIFVGDGTTTAFTLVNTSASTDTLIVTLNNVLTTETNALTGDTIYSASGSTLTFTDAPAKGVQIYVYTEKNDTLILNGTDSDSTDANSNIISDTTQETFDTYATPTDQLVLEYDTFATVAESTSIQKVYVNSNNGYTDLPTVAVASADTVSGTGAKLIANTTDIGAAESLRITDSGFTYLAVNPPQVTARAHFVLKDVTGTFTAGNTLTTHTGTVKLYDTDTQILDTTFENVVRFEQEQDGTFNEGVQLEQGTPNQELGSILLETEQDFNDGENIILDGTGTFTPSPQTFTLRVRVGRNSADTANIYYINDEAQPTITLIAGNTYYFDLSDSTLYNEVESASHIFKFSKTSDGTHNSGTAYTTGVTTSVASIDVGTTGAFIQIQLAYAVQGLYYYCVNHSGMGGFINTTQYETTITDAGDNIVFDSTDRGPNIALMLLNETGDAGSKSTDNVILEDNSGDLHLEETVDGQLADVGDNLLIDRYREQNNSEFLLLDRTDSSGANAGDRVANESSGQGSVILNGTDADSTDAMGTLLLADETGDGQLTLNRTDSDGTNAGDHIINQDPIDFSKQNVTITDSGGATATIFNADIATATSVVATQSTDTGSYTGINSRLGQDLVRVQDSYYYQDYSYEVQIGQSFATYINELKKAVHPAGFQPFGKVTLATLVSAAIQTTGAGLSGYTGDTQTFSPILGSVLETIFSQVLQSRLQVPTTTTADGQVAIGSRDDSFIQEDGSLPGDNLVLSGTDGSSTDAGDNIVFEDNNLLAEDHNTFIVLNGTDALGTDDGDNIMIPSTDGIDLEDGFNSVGDSILFEAETLTSTDDITSGTGDGAGKFMLETSHATSGNSDRSFVSEKKIKVISQSDRAFFEKNILLYLADTPFGTTNGNCGITLESGSGNLMDSLVLDGQLPFDEDNGANIVFNRTDISGSDAGDNVLLNGTDANGNNDGDKLVSESSIYSFPLGFRVDVGDRFLFDSEHNDETIPLSDISSFTFDQIRRVDQLDLDNTDDSLNWGHDLGGIVMENFGQILLDGTNANADNGGFKLAHETTKRNYFTLEETGTLITEDNSTYSNIARMELGDGTNEELGNILFEDAINPLESGNIELEFDDGEGVIILDATDSVGTNAGDKLNLEDSLRLRNIDVVLLETHNIIKSKGHIPEINYTLNSTSVITKGHVRSAEISVRSTGEIALEDATDTTFGFLLEETSGDNLDLEGATGITY